MDDFFLSEPAATKVVGSSVRSLSGWLPKYFLPFAVVSLSYTRRTCFRIAVAIIVAKRERHATRRSWARVLTPAIVTSIPLSTACEGKAFIVGLTERLGVWR